MRKDKNLIVLRNIAQGSSPFFWVTDRGEIKQPKQMATPHLFNAFRMLWNNTVAPAFRVGTFKRHKEVESYPPRYVERAGVELVRELSKRTDLTDDQIDTIHDIALNSDVLSVFNKVTV